MQERGGEGPIEKKRQRAEEIEVMRYQNERGASKKEQGGLSGGGKKEIPAAFSEEKCQREKGV